jgi:hypothetical protein
MKCLVLLVRKSQTVHLRKYDGDPTRCQIWINFWLQNYILWCLADDLPILEYGDLVGFGNDIGGIFEILRRENIADLDHGLADSDRADLQAYTAIVNSWLAEALMYELWLKENDATVAAVYFSSLPWPINKAIDWKQRRSVMSRLGVTSESVADRSAEVISQWSVFIFLNLEEEEGEFASLGTELGKEAIRGIHLASIWVAWGLAVILFFKSRVG